MRAGSRIWCPSGVVTGTAGASGSTAHSQTGPWDGNKWGCGDRGAVGAGDELTGEALLSC
eukprot:scaffold318204_cov18-Tisochrysis_lutea.AAC.1